MKCKLSLNFILFSLSAIINCSIFLLPFKSISWVEYFKLNGFANLKTSGYIFLNSSLLNISFLY